jgi:general secretion pathway protein L
MTISRQIAAGFSGWLDAVAAGLVTASGRISAAKRLCLVEQPNGTFVVDRPGKPAPVTIAGGTAKCSDDVAAALRGCRIELALRPDRFLFRTLELPKRAAEFLDGVVREQIDRITPWTASDAAVGWSKPSDLGTDKIAVTVAAAPRAQIVPLTQAFAPLGVRSVSVSTAPANAQDSISVFEQSAAGSLEADRVRARLAAVFVIAAILAGLAVIADVTVGGQLQTRQNDVARRIAERRGVMRSGNDAVSMGAMAQLARRKNQNAADVIVLEALSNVLPDNTYVTELRVEGDKMQIVGITGDAPSLIRLIEQSPHFSRATFFAPTTRAPSDPGDRYHIEARIKPVFAPPS